MFKKTIIFLSFALLMLGTIGCGTPQSQEQKQPADQETKPAVIEKDPLEGTWERSGEGDRYEGIQVKVEKLDNGQYQAEIITLNELAKKDGFILGDIKWRNITKIKDKKYEFKDLGKSPALEWYECQMTVSGDIIEARDVAENGEDFGSKQTWKRVGQ